MKITLYRNNPHAANGLMSQEDVECDSYDFFQADSRPNPRAPEGKMLLLNAGDFAAILVDTRAAPH